MTTESRSHTSHTKRSETEEGHRGVVDLALDVAIGGTSLVADKAIDAVERTADRAGDRLKDARERVHEAADEARHRLDDLEDRFGQGEDHSRYEERTKDELYQLAAERGIASRSTMRKAELIEALRAAR